MLKIGVITIILLSLNGNNLSIIVAVVVAIRSLIKKEEKWILICPFQSKFLKEIFRFK